MILCARCLSACCVPRVHTRASACENAAFPPIETILSSPLRILHVTAPARAGGLESVVRLLATGQQRAGSSVTVAAVVAEQEVDHPFPLALEEDGISCERITVGARGYIRECRRLRALCVQLKPDVVHTHGYRSDVIGCLAAASAGMMRVTTVHGFTGGDFKNRVHEWAQVRSYPRFNAVATVSRAIAKRLTTAGVRPDLIHTIPNAIDHRRSIDSRHDARRKLGLPNDAFVVGWVGRLSHEKGPDVFLEALARIEQPFKAVFIGNGPDNDALQATASQLGLGEAISWAGVLPDAASVFSAFDAFALSSRTEGIPIVLLEAMRANVPIVSTNVGGVPEMLEPTEALLIEPNRPDLLAAAIDAVRRQPDAARARVAAARARLERDFTVEPWVERYDALYRSILARPTGRSR